MTVNRIRVKWFNSWGHEKDRGCLPFRSTWSYSRLMSVKGFVESKTLFSLFVFNLLFVSNMLGLFWLCTFDIWHGYSTKTNLTSGFVKYINIHKSSIHRVDLTHSGGVFNLCQHFEKSYSRNDNKQKHFRNYFNKTWKMWN